MTFARAASLLCRLPAGPRATGTGCLLLAASRIVAGAVVALAVGDREVLQVEDLRPGVDRQRRGGGGAEVVAGVSAAHSGDGFGDGLHALRQGHEVPLHIAVDAALVLPLSQASCAACITLKFMSRSLGAWAAHLGQRGDHAAQVPQPLEARDQGLVGAVSGSFPSVSMKMYLSASGLGCMW